MRIFINLKQIGARRQKIAPVPFDYPAVPKTLRELITLTVRLCVEDYNARVRSGDEVSKPLSKENISDMATVGKIAFGINYGAKEQPLSPAVENAIRSFEDGLYRVFAGETELEALDENISLKEDETLTFIRLTMLSGRMW